MADVPRRASHARHEAAASEASATVEQFLLSGLDHYFAGRYEDAITIWSRVLFLDRDHARARAYIERARGAMAERQRESDELLHRGLAAFDEGDATRARRLLRSVIDRGGPSEVAISALERLERLTVPPRAAAAGPLSASEQPATEPPPAAGGPAVRRSTFWVNLGLVTLSFVVLCASSFIVLRGDMITSWLLGEPQPVARGAPAVQQARLPVPDYSWLLVRRAQLLWAKGRVRDALRVLDMVRADDPAKARADALRAELQRALFDAVRPASRGGPESATQR